MTQRPQIFFVVEDNEMILDTLVENLNDFGYTVYGAHNHAELSTLLKQVKPDMLLIDHFLPEKTGAEITSYLKGRQHKSIPTVILMSAHQHVKEIAKQIGVPFLEKPFSIDDLLRIVNYKPAATIRDNQKKHVALRAITAITNLYFTYPLEKY
ncbi:hypothetical protein A3B56_01930 [Candidatus Roizmanbacteria bacterium RIFCSPLOWO2_01_FULL_45_11]|uniref:Response regulatory domain-containing protein n=1 Tax=Candidatus Roizmanbacteria bacterium RIFCSPLOWO2_01_FULL_45_11 TaxID=1802070 RepID=A0A1F7JFZ8_9BACT|nr:MAG: hypothetical protein A3B56_01930 [Candidatus Roizmanbacteria bacterium RIFCSPLOWO2_01_FULL_45_11]